MGRSLQLSGRCGFLFGHTYPLGKLRIQNSDIQTTAFMVWTRELHISKLHASNQPSG